MIWHRECVHGRCHQFINLINQPHVIIFINGIVWLIQIQTLNMSFLFYYTCTFIIIICSSLSVSQRLIHILHNSEHPASCFAALDTGTILVSDLLFDVLMSKLTAAKTGRESFYQQRKGFRIESRGQRYELWDFVIKIGSVSLASNFKGILVEVNLYIIHVYIFLLLLVGLFEVQTI